MARGVAHAQRRDWKARGGRRREAHGETTRRALYRPVCDSTSCGVVLDRPRWTGGVCAGECAGGFGNGGGEHGYGCVGGARDGRCGRAARGRMDTVAAKVSSESCYAPKFPTRFFQCLPRVPASTIALVITQESEVPEWTGSNERARCKRVDAKASVEFR